MMKKLVSLMLAVLMLLSMCPAVAENTAVLEDGKYHVAVESDSGMFKVVSCLLAVQDGAYTATVTLSGTGYDKLFVGTGEEAAAAEKHIDFEEDINGAYTFTFPVEALDTPIAVAAHSVKKDSWYDRALTFKSEGAVQAMANGRYNVAVESSSDMFKVVGCVLTAKNGAYSATITMSGTGYDKLFLGTGEDAAAAEAHIEYVADAEGAYTFTFPLTQLDVPVAVAAHSVKKDNWYDRELTFKSEGAEKIVVVLTDGTYNLTVETDSGMFKVVNCVLTAEGGVYTATITMSGTGYDKLFVGTGEEAAAAENHIEYAADADGAYTFTLPVAQLDEPIAVAAHSVKKDSWYDRVLTFTTENVEQIETQDSEAASASLSAGVYTPDEFILTGGTGRVKISCEKVEIRDGQAFATIVFSSPNYKCVRIGDVVYDSVCDEKTSCVEFPVAVNQSMTMFGTTTAMSAAHEVEYSIFIRVDALKSEDAAVELPGLVWTSSMKPVYAEGFSVEYYEGGYALIDVKESARYLVVPEAMPVPEGLDPAIVILQQPLDNIYLAATSAMALFDSLDSLDAIRLVGTQKDGWYIENAVAAMEKGDMLFAGKYSEPDFEMLLTKGCDLAIESMMISHSPKVKEMLELLGIPVFIDRSSYESHPLGRTEWIKLYAVMMDKEEEAEAFFAQQAQVVEDLKGFENTGKSVAFFYIHTDGSAVVRSTADYVPGMIEIAGGKYVFEELLDPDSDRSSISISMEEFYNAAVDADFLIYNATIDAPISSVDELLAKSSLFADFKAVQEGNVWCTGKYLYQATDIVGNLITDINLMLTGETEGMTFIYKLN